MLTRLQLLRSSKPAATVSAGWLASDDAAEWLRELGHCMRQGCGLTLYPVARSVADPRPAGVLLLPKSSVPVFGPRVHLLAEILPGVYAPLEASLSAGLPANEREYHFPYAVHLFHPSLGLIGFDPKDALNPAKLLEPPRERGLLWNHAIPATSFAPEFRRILIEEPPGPNEMLAGAGDGIGGHAGRLPESKHPFLDKAGEIGKGIAGGALLGGYFLSSMMGKIGGMFGSGKGDKSSSHSGSLERWAEKQWKHLLDRRQKELDRLMDLLAKNPDEGLKYALPLSGMEQSRGQANPGWRLGTRNTNFRLGHGGGAIDGWDIGDDSRLKLERQYREAAKRETELGRHDRAAYIYGNLLGDWSSAARALIEGGRYRDAVAVYLHKLNNRPAAAKCLEDAGMLQQAAAMYAECKQFEKAGDLQAKLGNAAAARDLWQQEIEEQKDPLEKARILSEKLEDPAAATVQLEAAWTSGNRAEPALSALFTIHHKTRDTGSAISLLQRMMANRSDRLPLSNKLALSHRQAKLWEDEAFNGEFETLAYRNIAQELSHRSSQTKELLVFLPKLAEEDRLLARDAGRYRIHAVPPTAPSLESPRGILKPTQVITPSDKVRWDSLATLSKGISLAGYGVDMLAVAQWRDGSCHSSALRTPDDPGNGPVNHLVIRTPRNNSRLFHFKKQGRLHYRALDRVRTAADESIGTLRNILAIATYGKDGDFALLQYTNTSSLTLHLYSEAAGLRRSLPVDLAEKEAAALDWHLAGQGGHFAFAAGGFFVWRHPEGQFSGMQLPAPPSGLELSPVNGKEALLTVGSEVILVTIPARPGKEMETVHLHSGDSHQHPPVACFLADGSVVIAWRGGGVIYPSASRNKESATLAFSADAGIPVAIREKGDGGFAILTAQGKLLIFPR